jgi:hypothetical protein
MELMSVCEVRAGCCCILVGIRSAAGATTKLGFCSGCSSVGDVWVGRPHAKVHARTAAVQGRDAAQ